MKTELQNQLDAANKNGLLALLEAGAAAHKLPPAFVLAIASRETGIRNIEGDGGHGRGVIQIDNRYHPIARETDFRAHPEVLINYGCELLASNIAWARRLWPTYTEGQHLKIAAAAYNCGRGGVLKAMAGGDCDARTTGHDYGVDVLAMMKIFAGLLA